MKIKNLLGHRGYSAIAPENTKGSFDEALNYKFDGVELDVQMTRDGRVVIIHDETIDRTSNGSGKISEIDLDELELFDFAFYHDDWYNKEKILTLEEFLSLYWNKFKIINIELKNNVCRYEGMEKKILEILSKYEFDSEIILSSLNIDSLKIMSEISKKYSYGYIFSNIVALKKHSDVVKDICKYLNPWHKLLDNDLNNLYIRNMGMLINVWTFDIKENYDEWSKGTEEKYENYTNDAEIYSIISNEMF